MTHTKDRFRVKELTYNNGKTKYVVERYQITWAGKGWVSYHDCGNVEDAIRLRDTLNTQAALVTVVSERVIT